MDNTKQVIDWFEIPVSDMPRAQTFYEVVLQTTLHRENFAGPNMQMMVFKEDGHRAKGALMAGKSPWVRWLCADEPRQASASKAHKGGGRLDLLLAA